MLTACDLVQAWVGMLRAAGRADGEVPRLEWQLCPAASAVASSQDDRLGRERAVAEPFFSVWCSVASCLAEGALLGGDDSWHLDSVAVF